MKGLVLIIYTNSFRKQRLRVIPAALTIAAMMFQTIPAYALSPSRTSMSPEALGQLRSELRTSQVYDYRDIRRKSIQSLVRRKEMQIKDLFIERFIQIVGAVLNTQEEGMRQFAEDLEMLLRRAVTEDWPSEVTAKRFIEHENGSGYRLTPWHIQEIEKYLDQDIETYMGYVMNYRFLFQGVDFSKFDKLSRDAGSSLEDIAFDELFRRFIFINAVMTVANLSRLPEAEPSVKVGRQTNRDAFIGARRIMNTGILFYYDKSEKPLYSVQRGEETFSIPNQPLWVLSNGLLTINIRFLDEENFNDVLAPLMAVVQLPDNHTRDLRKVQVSRPGRSEIRSAAYTFKDINDNPAVRSLIDIMESNIRQILNREDENGGRLGYVENQNRPYPFNYYFSGFTFKPQDQDRVGKYVRYIFEKLHHGPYKSYDDKKGIRVSPEPSKKPIANKPKIDSIGLIEKGIFKKLHPYFNRQLPVQERLAFPSEVDDLDEVTIPVMPDGLMDRVISGAVKINHHMIQHFTDSSTRVPITGILFFNPDVNSTYQDVDIEGKVFRIPAAARLWPVEKTGVLAVNVNPLAQHHHNVNQDVVAILNGISYAIEPPSHNIHFKLIEPQGLPSLQKRSELRQSEQPEVLFSDQKHKEFIKALTSFGVHPGESYIIDGNYLLHDNGSILASLLVGFRQAGVPFVIVGMGQNHPGIAALNKFLEEKGQKPVQAAEGVDAALSAARVPGLVPHAIISPSFSEIEAARLKKQLEDKYAISIMTFREFTDKATQMAENFGLNAFAERLKTEILNQFFISTAA